MTPELVRRLYSFLLAKMRREAICGDEMDAALDVLHSLSMLTTEEAIETMLSYLERYEEC